MARGGRFGGYPALLQALIWVASLHGAEGQVDFSGGGLGTWETAVARIIRGALVVEGVSKQLDASTLQAPFKRALENVTGAVVSISNVNREYLATPSSPWVTVSQRINLQYRMLPRGERVDPTKLFLDSGMVNLLLWSPLVQACNDTADCKWDFRPANGWVVSPSLSWCIIENATVMQPILWPFTSEPNLTVWNATAGGGVVVKSTEAIGQTVSLTFSENVSLSSVAGFRATLSVVQADGTTTQVANVALQAPAVAIQGAQLRLDMAGKLVPGWVYSLTLPAGFVVGVTGKGFGGQVLTFTAGSQPVDQPPSSVPFGQTAAFKIFSIVFGVLAAVCCCCTCVGCCMVHRALSRMEFDEALLARSPTLRRALTVHRGLSRQGSRLARSGSRLARSVTGSLSDTGSRRSWRSAEEPPTPAQSNHSLSDPLENTTGTRTAWEEEPEPAVPAAVSSTPVSTVQGGVLGRMAWEEPAPVVTSPTLLA